MLLRSLHLPLFSYVVLSRFCSAQSVTVDDLGNSSAVTFDYFPPSRWSVDTGNNNTIAADAQVFNGTLHSCAWDPAVDTDFPQLTVNFSGTTINLFGALQRNVLTSVDIAINGTNVTRFSQIQNNDVPFLYNISLYSNFSLPPGQHTLTVSPAAEDFSVIYVDYLTYTPVLLSTNQFNGPLDPIVSELPSSTAVVPSITAPAPTDFTQSFTASVSGESTTTLSSPIPELAPTDSVTSSSPSLPSSTSNSVASSNNTQSSSNLKQDTVSPTMMYIIIASSVGGAILFFLAVALCLICRARRSRSYKAVPYFTINGGASLASPNTQELGKVPNSASSRLPFFSTRPRSNSNSTTAPSPTILLSHDFHNTPTLTSELESVFRQLEELSLEVETLQARSSFISISASTISASSVSASSESSEESDLAPPPPQVPPLQVRGSIDRIRNEVERLRRQSSHTLNGLKDVGTAVVTQEMIEMLHDLALLRAEVEDMLADQMREGGEIERLPSYRSARSSPCPPPTEAPPPLPSTPSPAANNDRVL